MQRYAAKSQCVKFPDNHGPQRSFDTSQQPFELRPHGGVSPQQQQLAPGKEETVPSEGRNRHVQHQMTVDGPCSILRDGRMYNFPLEFSNSRGVSTRDQLYVPQQIRQTHLNRPARFQHQHQHQRQQSGHPMLHRGSGPTRREHGKKESSLPLQHDMGTAAAAIAVTSTAPGMATAVTEASLGRYDIEEQYNYGNGDEPFSAVLNGNTEEPQHLRSPRGISALVGKVMNDLPASNEWEGPDPALSLHMLGSKLPPPPTDAGNSQMSREYTFPPANFGLPADVVQNCLSMPSAVSAVIGVHERSGVIGLGAESGAGGNRNGGSGGGIGNVSSDSLCGVNGRDLSNGMGMDSGSRENACGASYVNDPRTRGHWYVDEAGGRSPGARGDESLEMAGRGVRPSRRSSFDKLAALIPGVPHQMQSRSSSPAMAPEDGSDRATHGGSKPLSPALTATNNTVLSASVGRPSGRQMKPRKPRDVVDGRRNNKRPGGDKSCAPCLPGEPWDPAKDERRKIVINRYMRKRSRRSLADKIRDESPSRSRPKAASRRPREKGKFVKNSPDFVAVTAVTTKREQQTSVSSKGVGLRGKSSHVRQFGLKQEKMFGHSPGGGGGPPIMFGGGDDGVSLGVSDSFLWS